jgi:acyl carrier protein
MKNNFESDIPIELIKRVKNAFCEALTDNFTDEEFTLLKFKSTRTWDSISHIRLMSVLRDEFAIKFTFEEMIRMTTFDEVLNVINSRRGEDSSK